VQQNNDHSQCILLALCVCALGRGLPEKVLGLGQPRGGVGSPPFGGGWGPPPPPTAPQTVEHPSGSHIGWRPPPWAGACSAPFRLCPPCIPFRRFRYSNLLPILVYPVEVLQPYLGSKGEQPISASKSSKQQQAPQTDKESYLNPNPNANPNRSSPSRGSRARPYERHTRQKFGRDTCVPLVWLEYVRDT
jgi:hypothetical protein